MREYKLLISHVSKDEDIALKCVAAFENIGVVGEGDDSFKIVPIYMESETNGCFGDFMEWSEKAVINSDGVLAIITDNTAETSISADGVEANVKVVYNETSLARSSLKDILVLRKQGVSLQSGYKLLLQNIKCEYYDDDLDNAVANIVTDVILHARRRFGGHPLLEYAGITGTRLIPTVIEDTGEYLGRADKLKEIDDCFSDGKRVVCITGFGGIGKTTLAKMYAKAHPEDPVAIQYCSDEETNLKNAVVSLSMEYDSPEYGNMTVDERYALRISQLGNLDKRTLIIIDNFNADFGLVSNREVLTELSAIEQCKFIISSRNTLTRKDIGVVEVGKLNDDELMELFYRDSRCERTKQNDGYIKQLIVQTNGHTMTVELAAKAIGIDVNGVSLQEVVDGLLSGDAVTNVEDRHDGFFEYETIYAHLRKLFKLSQITYDEKKLLGALSFVARRGLTIGELKDNVEYDTRDLIRLCNLGYIAKSDNAVITYSLHPLMSELVFMDFVRDLEQFKKVIDYLVYQKTQATGNDTLADLDMRLDYAEHIYGRLYILQKNDSYAEKCLYVICNRLGDITQAKGDINGAERYYMQGYKIIKAISEAKGTINSRREFAGSCHNLGDILQAKGDIDGAESYFIQSYKIMQAISEEVGTIGYRQDFCISCNRVGDILREKGDIDGAERYYMQSYKLRVSIFEAEKTIESRRDLSLSYEKLGGIARTKGDIDSAERYYKEYYNLAKAVYDEKATIESQRNLSISCNRLGDISKIKGDIAAAEWYYMQDYELSKAISERTGTISARRDLFVGKNKLGDIMQVKGDIAAAEQYYIQGYELAKTIYEETGTIESQQDLSTSCNKLGDISRLNGDMDSAEKYYRQDYDLSKAIVDMAETIEFLRNLSVSCNNLANLLRMKGDNDGAELYYRQCYELTKKIYEKTETGASRRGLSTSCEGLGDISRAKGDIDSACQYYKQSYELREVNYKETGTIESRRDLSISCNKLGEISKVKGDVDRAERYYKQAYELREVICKETDTIESRRDLSISCNKLGEISKVKGDIIAAERYFRQGYMLSKAIVEETGTIAAKDDFIVANYKMSEVAGFYESSIQYLYSAFEIAEDLYKRHVDYNGRYKAMVLLLSDIYIERNNIDGYQKMQNILKSLS